MFQNLATQSRCLAYVNALGAMWPMFQPQEKDPRGSKDIGDRYKLLGPTDTTLHYLSDIEQAALHNFCSGDLTLEDMERRSVYRWARLKLPVEQISRS